MMQLRTQIFAVLVTSGVFTLVFELVRRRRMMERYALLWLLSTATLLTLAVWRGLLEALATAVGIYYGPSGLFAAVLIFVLALLLHFSVVISRLTEQNRILAQRVGELDERLERESSEAARHLHAVSSVAERASAR